MQFCDPPVCLSVCSTRLARNGSFYRTLIKTPAPLEWLGSRVVSVLDSDAEGPGFKSQLRRCRVTVLGKLFTPVVLLFIKQRNW